MLTADVVDVGISDHFLVRMVINAHRSKPDLRKFTFRDYRSVDLDNFGVHLRTTDAYTDPADDVDTFCSQLQSAVTAVLDNLAPLKSRTKRRGKHSSRWLSDAAVAAKRKRRQLESDAGDERAPRPTALPTESRAAPPTPRSTHLGVHPMSIV